MFRNYSTLSDGLENTSSKFMDLSFSCEFQPHLHLFKYVHHSVWTILIYINQSTHIYISHSNSSPFQGHPFFHRGCPQMVQKNYFHYYQLHYYYTQKYSQMLSAQTIQQLTNIIIRPHRQIYTFDKLGPRKIVVKSAITGRYLQAIRKQATLLNHNKKLQISLFEPENHPIDDNKGWHSPSNYKKQPFEQLQYKSTILSADDPPSKCTIFLHSNSGSRLEGLQYVRYLLQFNHNVCIFDYSGSGLSQGDYVTMGINQSQDLKKVINFLKERYNISQFTLWGRSMGAVTAIIYASIQPTTVSRMVLDSPFSNFKQLLKEIVNSRTGLPSFLFGSILEKIQEEIILKTSHNLMEIDLRKNIKEKGMSDIECLFLISRDDQLVKPSHVEILHSMHEGQKDILYLEGSHSKPRSHEIREKCAKFLCEQVHQLKLKTEKISQPVSLTSHRKASQTVYEATKHRKVVESMIISESTQSSKNINNSPKGLTKISIQLKGEGKNQPTISTQRDDQSINKGNSNKVSLSQLKRTCNLGMKGSVSFKKSQQINTNGSHIFEKKKVFEEIKEIIKEEGEQKIFKNKKTPMTATKFKNKLKNQLKKN